MANGTPAPPSSAGGYIATFLWALVCGMGFRVGWGLIGLIIDLIAKSVGR
jgi:hypothetical protein